MCTVPADKIYGAGNIFAGRTDPAPRRCEAWSSEGFFSGLPGLFVFTLSVPQFYTIFSTGQSSCIASAGRSPHFTVREAAQESAVYAVPADKIYGAGSILAGRPDPAPRRCEAWSSEGFFPACRDYLFLPFLPRSFRQYLRQGEIPASHPPDGARTLLCGRQRRSQRCTRFPLIKFTAREVS